LSLEHGTTDALTDAHVVFLPPGFHGTLGTKTRGALLLAVVPDAATLDPEFAAKPPTYRVVDWKHEPLLGSEHDARRRIYLATPALFGTKALKGEMIIYPPQTASPNHHHVGAAHFMYFLKGGGTCYASEQPFTVRAGDVVYYGDAERHYLRGADDGEMVFSEFFVPGIFKTVWVEPNKACAWNPTGTNFLGTKASREIKAHSLARGVPTDV
jgi:quercetin dioxygenase-like cupin family protein